MSAWEDTGKSDEWYTPQRIFNELGCWFDMDVAAPAYGPRHVPCSQWLCDDALSRKWEGFVWMNPPFGKRNAIIPWLEKFFEHGNGIALVPDRTSAPWFQDFAPKADAILFVCPKIRFERPDGSVGKSPGCGTALLAAGEQGTEALMRAEISLGMVVTARRETDGEKRWARYSMGKR